MRAGGAREQPRQAVLPRRRPHQDGPRQLLPRVPARGRAPPARAADRAQALGRRGRRRAVLPEARARQRARVAADGHRHVPQRPPRARARRQRRRPPRVGRQPRRHRLEPLARAPQRSRPSRRAARRPRPRPRRALLAGARRGAGRARGARRARPARLSQDVRLARHPRVRAHRAARAGFTEVRRAALALAREVERRMPRRATSSWWKEERDGVFIDYNQNARDRTVASAYSRPRRARRARVLPARVGRGRRRRARRAAPSRPSPRACASAGTPPPASTQRPCRLDGLLELAARDEREGLGDAPWPPHFRKQKGEPPRVQPSRARSSQPEAE